MSSLGTQRASLYRFVSATQSAAIALNAMVDAREEVADIPENEWSPAELKRLTAARDTLRQALERFTATQQGV